MNADHTTEFDIAVIGGGLAGMSAALAFAHLGHSVALLAPKPDKPDHRTTALLIPSVAFMRRLGVWESVEPHAAPLATMRIIDATNRLIRAPMVSFHAGEIGEDVFGWNVANTVLGEALTVCLADIESLEVIEEPASAISQTPERVAIETASGRSVTARFAIAADGRNSLARQAAGIATRDWSYPQAALVTNFKHDLPHGGVSTEFHTEHGPFTQVPLPGNRSSLVWVNAPAEAERLATLNTKDLSQAIETRMQSIFGKVEVDGPVQRYPLSGMTARRFASGRILLAGEAAHVLPPIGAQGLNLGLRDVMAAEDAIGPAAAAQINPKSVADAYDRARRADVNSRLATVDLLNRSLLSGFLPLHAARGLGLLAVSMVKPLKTAAMREGMKPGSSFSGFLGDLREQIARKQPGRNRV